MYTVRFLKTNFERVAYKQNILAGKVKDPFSPTVSGVGYLGNSNYKGFVKEYHIWRSILKRCYDEKSKDYSRYGGVGVTVCDRWHSFENFLNDLPNLPGYSHRKFTEGSLQIDKDFLSGNLKRYSPSTCRFVSPKENSEIIDRSNRQRPFKAISPNGEIFSGTCIKDFASDHGLCNTAITNCLKGRYKMSKGWSFYYSELTPGGN